MKARAEASTVQRASRLRIAVALCAAGLATGTLGSNLVGAGAGDPPAAVPGESVSAPPTQIAADTAATGSTDPSTSTTPHETQTTPATTTPADPPADAPAADTTAPAVSEPTAAPAAAAAPASPAAPAAPASSQPAAKKPAAGDEAPLGALAGAPQPADPQTAPCPTSKASRTRRSSRHVVGAKTAGATVTRACRAPAPQSTILKTGGSRGGDDRDEKPARGLRNAQGVPTLFVVTGLFRELGSERAR